MDWGRWKVVFAMVEHRVSMRNGVLNRAVDPAESPDPKIRALVTALADLPVSPPPREHFRAELRAQLVAVAPRLVNEGMAGLVRHTPESYANAHVRPSRWHLISVRMPKLHLGRPIRLATAALAVVVLLASGAVWLSRSALPGDPLYNVKRASENAQLSLESGIGKAKALLDLAKTRVGEVAALLSVPTASGTGPQADGGVSGHTASLVRGTLGSADEDLRQAASLLNSSAVRHHSTGPLETMIAWAPGQQSRLAAIIDHIPDGSLHNRAESSWTLVSQAYARASALQTDLGCSCLATSGSDSLGPLPCSACTVGNPSLPVQKPATPGAGSSSTPAQHTGSSAKGNTNGSSTAKAPATSGGSSVGVPGPITSSPPGLPTLPTLPGLPTLPTLPTLPPVTSLPVHIPTSPVLGLNSCGATVGLGPIGVGVGTCGVNVQLGN